LAVGGDLAAHLRPLPKHSHERVLEGGAAGDVLRRLEPLLDQGGDLVQRGDLAAEGADVLDAAEAPVDQPVEELVALRDGGRVPESVVGRLGPSCAC
jgi:hypothetical protein